MRGGGSHLGVSWLAGPRGPLHRRVGASPLGMTLTELLRVLTVLLGGPFRSLLRSSVTISI